MERHEAVSKVLRDMKASGLIDPKYAADARMFLNALWGAGWDKGRYDALIHHRTKVILQYNRDNILVGSYKGFRDAERKTGFRAKSIQSALTRDSLTKQGFYWKYA